MKHQAKRATDEEIVKTTIRLSRRLSDALKHRAIDENCNLQELVARALESYLKQKGDRQ